MKLAVTYMNDIDVHTLKTAGADAVILGIERFSMRMASPIPLDALADTVRAIHAQHLECWVTMNAPIHEADLDAMEAALKQVLDAGVDNVLFADLAVLAAAGPDKKRLIYHPETYATDVGDNRFYANEGIAGIVAGRELTIDAIEAMAEGPLPLLVVGHGHSPMFHSRRPLVEHYFEHTGDADADIIKTKKTLTLVEESRQEAYPIVQDAFGTHVFRAKPTASFTVLKRLSKVVDTLIIDGLWLTPDDIVQTVSDYRAALSDKPLSANYEGCDDGFYFKKTVALKEDA